MPKKLQDLTGLRFGTLTVIRRTDEKSPSGSWLWEAKCDCGKTVKWWLAKFKSYCHAVKNCGCRDKNGPANRHWCGHGEISGHAWAQIKHGAKRRNLPVTITIEEAWQLFLLQNKKCAFSGEVLTFADFNLKSLKDRRISASASLDRKDSKEGYHLNNVQWVHKIVNKMKGELRDQEFKSWCKKIYTNKNETT